MKGLYISYNIHISLFNNDAAFIVMRYKDTVVSTGFIANYRTFKRSFDSYINLIDTFNVLKIDSNININELRTVGLRSKMEYDVQQGYSIIKDNKRKNSKTFTILKLLHNAKHYNHKTLLGW